MIAIISGNIHPSTRCFLCAVGKGNQCDKATRALAITIEKADRRILGRRKLSVITHRAGGIDDEHRCGLIVAGLSRGGRVHLHLQRDPIGVVFRVADTHSGLADGINARNVGDRISAGAVVLDPSTAVVMAVDYAIFAGLIRQHVQRQ